MINKTKPQIFQPYIDATLEKCKKMSFEEKKSVLWERPEIIEYFALLPIDEPTKHIERSLRDELPDLNKKKILIVGGGTGGLGRYIVTKNSGVFIMEIDTSDEMVCEANRLAKEHEAENRYSSIVADAGSIPFADNEFDYSIAYGVFRYINQKDRKKAVDEMSRVSKFGVNISDGRAKDIICSLRDMVNPDLRVFETEVEMFRMTLFYMLCKLYETDKVFRGLVDNSSDNPYRFIGKLAGKSKGKLYELKI